MKKSTFRASSDVALVKYWGKKNEQLRLPENGSLSIILRGLDTITTVEFQEGLSQDYVLIQGTSNLMEAKRVVEHLDRIRNLSGESLYAQVQSINTFPKGTGLSSSGSGFAALTYAATTALGLDLTEKELSILARYASGTACRCVCGGFVEWKDGNTSDTSYSETIFPPDYWDLRDIAVVISEDTKLVSSTEGHKIAKTSPFFATRQRLVGKKLTTLKRAIKDRNFSCFGEIVESEALEFHSILLTSRPPLIAWYPGTIEVMHHVQQLRREGIEAYFTINTGFNVHVLTVPMYEDKVRKRLATLPLVENIVTASVGEKPCAAPSLF